MIILSIETSCDETAISIIKASGKKRNAIFEILANEISSQATLHSPYGGVYPSLAKREHNKNLPIIFKKVFRQAGFKKNENPIDLIAVTYGPGLEPSLWTGITFAKELAEKWKIPIIPVNHMEGHFFSVFAKNKKRFTVRELKRPILSLLVSGGHTELIVTKRWMQYKKIGQTLDDAIGESFDKVARMLGLPYPGGPQISKLASLAENSFSNAPIKLPRPMLHTKDFNFSYSGLKTAVLYLIKKIGKINENTKAQIALEFEKAAIEPLIYKTQKAIKEFKINTLIVAGGVSANKRLQIEIKKMVKDKKKIKVFFPDKENTGDNSLMVGIAGYLNFIKNKKKQTKKPIEAIGNLSL